MTIPAWAFAITVPIGLGMGIIAILAVRDKKTPDATLGIAKSEDLVDTLTAMHWRLIELRKEKASHTRIRSRRLNKVLPTLADRMGTVKLKDWSRFEKSVKRRIRRASPQRNFKGRFNFKERARYKDKVHYAALRVASEVQAEHCQSKEWTLEDCITISEWVDSYHWGVTELRDNDESWGSLNKSISHYLRDPELRALIGRHKDLSLAFNNIYLLKRYSEGRATTSFATMLHAWLVGSPISPDKVEAALSEILEDIEQRLTKKEERKRK